MSLERIAEILCVDEVAINHGPRGVAVHVRTDKTWRSAAIDNDDLVKGRGHGDQRSPQQRRLESIAQHLAFLADADIPKVRDLRRSQVDAATRAALRADQETRRAEARGFGLSWDDVGGFDNPRDGVAQQQLVKSEPAVPARPPEFDAPPEPAVTEAMPSRFHAIMAELRCL